MIVRWDPSQRRLDVAIYVRDGASEAQAPDLEEINIRHIDTRNYWVHRYRSRAGRGVHEGKRYHCFVNF